MNTEPKRRWYLNRLRALLLRRSFAIALIVVSLVTWAVLARCGIVVVTTDNQPQEYHLAHAQIVHITSVEVRMNSWLAIPLAALLILGVVLLLLPRRNRAV